MTDEHQRFEAGHEREIFQLQLGMVNIEKRLGEIQASVAELLRMDKSIAQMDVRNGNFRSEMDALWKKADHIHDWTIATDKVLSQRKGERAILTIVLSFIQLISVSAGGYIGYQWIETAKLDSVQSHKIIVLEHKLELIEAELKKK